MKTVFYKKKLKAFSLVEISMVILIIGILISGIAKSFDLYEDFILVNAQKMTKNSIVPRIEGLGLWLETTLDESFNSNFTRIEGSNFLPWKSIALSGYPVTINSGGPAFYFNKKINSLPSVSMTNGGYYRGYLASENFSSENIASIDGVTFFIVFKCDSQYPGTCGTPMSIESPDAKYRYGISHIWGYLSFWLGEDPSLNWAGYEYADKYMHGNPHIISARANASKMIISLDGSQVASSSVVNSIKPTNEVHVKIGYSNGESPPFRYMSGSVGEIIVYGRPLTDQQFKSVEEYLSKKWRIPINK